MTCMIYENLLVSVTLYLHLVKFTRFEKFCGALQPNVYKNQTTPWEPMESEKHNNLMSKAQNPMLEFQLDLVDVLATQRDDACMECVTL